jgi:HSP20 family protein
MTLIKFKTDNPVRNSQRLPMWSDLFNDLFDTVASATDVRKGTLPSVNVMETDDSYRLELAAPGLKKEDFKISVENETLTISAETKKENSEKNERFTRREFSYSSFVRSFTLPEMVNTEMISASYDNGLMKISIPKKEEAKVKAPREITVS